jgi:hypothetical protein
MSKVVLSVAEGERGVRVRVWGGKNIFEGLGLLYGVVLKRAER